VSDTLDPGWRAAIRGLLYSFFLPLLLVRWARKAREPRLILLRTTFVAVAGSLPLLLWSVALLHVRAEPGVRWWGWVLLSYPIAATLVFQRITSKQLLEATTVRDGAKAYVVGHLILLGLALTAALFGHGLVYFGGGTPPAVIGTAVSLILMWPVAPRAEPLASHDAHFVSMGGSSLTFELMRPQTSSAG
jgi:hypothetical protein